MPSLHNSTTRMLGVACWGVHATVTSSGFGDCAVNALLGLGSVFWRCLVLLLDVFHQAHVMLWGFCHQRHVLLYGSSHQCWVWMGSRAENLMQAVEEGLEDVRQQGGR